MTGWLPEWRRESTLMLERIDRVVGVGD